MFNTHSISLCFDWIGLFVGQIRATTVQSGINSPLYNRCRLVSSLLCDNCTDSSTDFNTQTIFPGELNVEAHHRELSNGFFPFLGPMRSIHPDRQYVCQLLPHAQTFWHNLDSFRRLDDHR